MNYLRLNKTQTLDNTIVDCSTACYAINETSNSDILTLNSFLFNNFFLRNNTYVNNTVVFV